MGNTKLEKQVRQHNCRHTIKHIDKELWIKVVEEHYKRKFWNRLKSYFKRLNKKLCHNQ